MSLFFRTILSLLRYTQLHVFQGRGYVGGSVLCDISGHIYNIAVSFIPL